MATWQALRVAKRPWSDGDARLPR